MTSTKMDEDLKNIEEDLKNYFKNGTCPQKKRKTTF
jgi:hypothetical protein